MRKSKSNAKNNENKKKKSEEITPENNNTFSDSLNRHNYELKGFTYQIIKTK